MALKLLKEQDWISIYERTPGLDDEVLASDGQNRYIDEFIEWEDGNYRFSNPKTLYWMELPGLPR